jgi:hypothetical protein
MTMKTRRRRVSIYPRFAAVDGWGISAAGVEGRADLVHSDLPWPVHIRNDANRLAITA